MKDYFVGLDIGTSKVSAAIGKLDKLGNLVILGVASEDSCGVKRSIIDDSEKASRAISKCIKKLERMVEIKIDEVSIALSGGVCEIVHNKGVVAVASEDRIVSKEDVNRVLDAAKLIFVPSDKEIIGVKPEQFVLDGSDNIKDPIGMDGLKLEVDANVLLTDTSIINGFTNCLKVAGLKLGSFFLKPESIVESIIEERERDKTIALIDVGLETSEISIIREGSLCYTAIIPVGGKNISNDVAIGLKVSYNEAEKLKLSHSNLDLYEKKHETVKETISNTLDEAKDLDLVFLKEIIEARVEEILLLIKKELIESSYFDELSVSYIIGGGMSFFDGIKLFAEDVLGTKVRLGVLNISLEVNPTFCASVSIVNDLYAIEKRNSRNNAFFESKEINDFWDQGNKDENFISRFKNFLSEFF